MDKSEDVVFFEAMRWGGRVACPYCSSLRITRRKDQRFHCNSCQISFGVLTGTPLGGSKMPLEIWFQALQIVLDSRRPVGGRELGRLLGVNKMTGCRMNQKIQEGMRKQESRLLFQRILAALEHQDK